MPPSFLQRARIFEVLADGEILADLAVDVSPRHLAVLGELSDEVLPDTLRQSPNKEQAGLADLPRLVKLPLEEVPLLVDRGHFSMAKNVVEVEDHGLHCHLYRNNTIVASRHAERGKDFLTNFLGSWFLALLLGHSVVFILYRHFKIIIDMCFSVLNHGVSLCLFLVLIV